MQLQPERTRGVLHCSHLGPGKGGVGLSVATGRWPNVRNFIFSACASHAASATTATTPALLLFKERLGIEGGSTSRCCDTYEN